MVTTWHPALKHLSKILNNKNIINILKRASTFQEISERQKLFTEQDIKYMVTFILATLERN